MCIYRKDRKVKKCADLRAYFLEFDDMHLWDLLYSQEDKNKMEHVL